MKVGREVGRASHLFAVPAVHSVDDGAYRFSVDWVDGYTPLAELRLDTLDRGRLLERVGRVLRTIHDATWESGSGSTGLFHGDYDLYNVGLDPAGGLVVLDWDPADTLRDSTLDHRHRDLGMFLFSMAVWCLHKRHRSDDGVLWFHAMVAGYFGGGDESDHLRTAFAAADDVGAWLRKPTALPRTSWPARCYYWFLRRGASRLLGRWEQAASSSNRWTRARSV